VNRAVSLKPIDLPASIREDEAKYTLREAAMKFREQGLELKRMTAAEMWYTQQYLDLHGKPSHFTARLITACGATQERIWQWPPPRDIRLHMSNAVTFASLTLDPKAQVTVQIRTFERVSSGIGREGGVIVVDYREKL
jgi:hypothetical protein